MGILTDISATPVASEPVVWISRFAVYKSFDASPPATIRDFPLQRGLNIIWAREDEGESPEQGIYGHSAGKTTFCRLLRYILGEPSFGNQRTTRLIKKAFPEGYVAAEIHVAGVAWAVRRPIGKGRYSYIRQNSTVEELIKGQASAVSQEEYAAALDLENLPNSLEAKTIARSNADIQWGHILSWCARDQETRYQSLHEWRSPRSNSNAPTFSFPKTDPLFVMRSVLGLFIPEELELERKIAELQTQNELLKANIEEKRHEPEYWKKHYIAQLRQILKNFSPSGEDLSERPFRTQPCTLPGFGGHSLEHLATVQINQLESRHAESERKALETQQQIDALGVAIKGYSNRIKVLQTSIDADAAAIKGIDEHKSKQQINQEIQKIIDSNDSDVCEYGDVSFNKCEYIQNRFSEIFISDGYNAQATIQERTDRCKRKASTESDLQRIIRMRREFEGKQRRLCGLRDEYIRSAYSFREEIKKLKHIVHELDQWTNAEANPGANSELAALQNDLILTTAQHEQLTNELRSKFHEHDADIQFLRRLFSTIVRAVLRNDKYDGVVAINSEGEVEFQITHGPAMSGEAIETLSVLIADITSVFYGVISSKCRHPRFLLHDSPHEADLARSIYRSFIQVIADFQAECDLAGTVPFQYILTTTSAPPEQLQGEDYLKLDLSAPDNMFLRCDIRTVTLETPMEQNLFSTAT